MTKYFLIFLLTYIPSSYAQTLIEAGIHYGGDELVTTNFTNGQRISDRAGNLFSLAFGGTKAYSDTVVGQFSIGAKTDIVNNSNPEVTWVRFPLNTTLFYRQAKYRVGLGLTVHFSPKLKGTGVASNITTDFKDAIGGIFEVDFNIGKTFLWGLRYTRIDYQSKIGDRRMNGDSLGLLIIALL